MRVLIFSDLHLHNHNYGSTMIDGVNSRLLDGANILDQVAAYCKENEVDRVVFGGDLFHTHGKIQAEVLKVAFEGFVKIKAQVPIVTALVGNHDTSDITMATHAMHWLKGLGVNVIDSPSRGDGFAYLPYVGTSEEVQMFFDKTSDGMICFLHQGLAGVPMKSGFVPGSEFSEDMIPDRVAHAFTGHYHPHRRVSEKATVIGSCMQLNWADEGDERGFIIMDTTAPADFEFIPFNAPRFVTYNMGNALRVGRQNQGNIPGNFIRVKNYYNPNMEDIREEFMGVGAMSVEFVVEKEQGDRLRPVSSDELHIPDLIKAFEEGKDLSDERIKIGQELRT